MPANNLQWIKETMSRKNLEWSLKPILIWMKWINGINLVTKSRRISVMGFIMVIINFTVNAIACYAIIGSLLTDKEIPSLKIFCVGLDRANFLLYTMGTYVTFYVISQTKWRSLWTLIIDIEQNCKFTQKFYSDLRSVVLYGSVFFFLHICVTVYMSASLFFQPDFYSLFRPIAITITNFFDIITVSILVLFFILVWMATAMLEALKQVAPSTYVDNNYSADDKNKKIEEWRQNFNKVNQVIGGINQCFGLILLLAIASIFLNFITDSFALMVSVITEGQTAMLWLYIIRLVKNTTLLWMITLGPYRLRSKASNVVATLRENTFSTLPSLALKFKYNSMVMEVGQSIPRISAVQLFDVDMQLFPCLIGTTLTYLVILYQAYDDNNKSA